MILPEAGLGIDHGSIGRAEVSGVVHPKVRRSDRTVGFIRTLICVATNLFLIAQLALGIEDPQLCEREGRGPERQPVPLTICLARRIHVLAELNGAIKAEAQAIPGAELRFREGYNRAIRLGLE